MIIGIPKEIIEHEYRVGVIPSGVGKLVSSGHRLIVEKSAGAGSGYPDEEYEQAGAELTDKYRVFNEAELIIKVKEPISREYDLLKNGQALFTFLHLAPNPQLIDLLLKKSISAFAYETLEVDGRLPLLEPMSEIAGKMAPVIGAHYLQRIYGGSGILITGAGGVVPARVLILGAGRVGIGALQVAFGMGADVAVMNRGQERLKIIDRKYEGKVRTLLATKDNIEEEVMKADILIGAVLVAGARTPHLVSESLVSKMKNGSVVVDVSVDQGGCIETTRPTTHSDPVYSVDGVIHYTVANMPGAYPRTSTLALTEKTLPYIQMLATVGIENAVNEPALKSSLNTYGGRIMHETLLSSIDNS